MLDFRRIDLDRSIYIPLLLEGDEDIAMLNRYLDKGDLFGLFDADGVVTLALVTADGNGAELMNIVTVEKHRGKGYGSLMLSYLSKEFSAYGYLTAGTGDCSPARLFYEKNGFSLSGLRKGFFLQYDHPVIENGRRLTDMVLYRKRIG